MTRDRKEYLRQWHLKNRERRLVASKERYVAKRELILKQTKEWALKHPESKRLSWQKYQANNKELCRKRNREWYQLNLDKQRLRVRIKQKRIYALRKEQVLEENRIWRSKNKSKIRARDLKRKALLKGAAVNLAGITEWMERIKSQPTAVCYYCDSCIPSSSIHFDHIVPLSKGGPHSIENLCVSCAPCNLSKKATLVSAWVRIGQQVLEL